MTLLVISDAAAEHLVGSALSVDELLRPEQGELVRTVQGGNVFIVTGRERANFKYATVDADELRKLPAENIRHALPRIDRALKATARMPIRFPPSWSEFHVGPKVAFFALPREFLLGFRWIAQFDSEDDRFLFRRITSVGAEIPLDAYSEPLPPSYRHALELQIAAAKRLRAGQVADQSSLVQTFDFDLVGAQAISSSLRVEEWLPKLKGGQRKLAELPPLSSARVVGPAGSGKTLALCVRALIESRAARRDGRRIKILFATHSWAMTERVDRSLVTLNDHEAPADVDVMPLVQVLRQTLAESYAGSLSVLGDDSTEGRQLQTELVAEVISTIPQSDIEALKRFKLSPAISEALKAGSTHRAELVDDLCSEFTGVLLAENISPGDLAAEERYLSAERSDEMPPFKTRGDRMFALLAYRGYLSNLREWGAITTDQLVNDAIRVLETFSWSVRRDVEGYDLIFVDELQLFDAQERLAVTLLTRNPTTAAFVTAEDPSQGVFSAVSSQWRRELPARGGASAVQLTAVHRFNEKILAFIKFLYSSFPLNADSVPFDPYEGPPTGQVPLLQVHRTAAQVRNAVVSAARSQAAKLGKGERLAVIALDSSASAIAKELSTDLNVVMISGHDDVEKLTYSRRATVVGNWQYMGGTQFSHVIVTSSGIGDGKTAFSRMKDLISLYVAASRASEHLEMHVSGTLPVQLEGAGQQGIVRLERRL